MSPRFILFFWLAEAAVILDFGLETSRQEFEDVVSDTDGKSHELDEEESQKQENFHYTHQDFLDKAQG